MTATVRELALLCLAEAGGAYLNENCDLTGFEIGLSDLERAAARLGVDLAGGDECLTLGAVREELYMLLRTEDEDEDEE